MRIIPTTAELEVAIIDYLNNKGLDINPSISKIEIGSRVDTMATIEFE